MAGTLGAANPLRYRGYVYDSETGLYYLQSRYYDPEICRFINADAFASTGQSLIGGDAFAYCLNNPVRFVDKTGHNAGAYAVEWSSTMWWLVLIDGPLPIGDIVYYGGMIFLFGIAVISGNSQAQLPLTDFESAEESLPNVEFPGNDPTKAPEGYEWKGEGSQGSKNGSYYNPNTGESLHPDLDHPAPVGPHWDYGIKGSKSKGWRVFPDGRVVSKDKKKPEINIK